VTAHIRWQALLISICIILLIVLVVYLGFNFTTVVVPDHDGTYIEGLIGVPQYVNPVLCQYNRVDQDLVALIFNGLTKVNDQGEIVGDLAKDFAISEDGLTYTFYLRDGVHWHDGEPFSADDVVFTISAIQDPDFQGVPYLAELWKDVAVHKIDDQTVELTLAEPFTPFIDYTTIGILPRHLLEDVPAAELPQEPFNLQPVGTGPFAVERVTAESARLKVNVQTWRTTPFLNSLEFRFYPSYEAAFHAYDQGTIEGIAGLRPTDIEWVQEHDSLQQFTSLLAGYAVIYLNWHNPNTLFLQDKKVRQALLYGLDRQKIIDDILNGQGIVADSPILCSSWAYDAQVRTYPHDPGQARTLLEEAGWVDSDQDGIREKDGQPLQFALLGSNEPQRQAILEEVSRQWEQIGVKADPQTAGVSGLVRDFLRPRRFDTILTEWRGLPPDPDPYPMWHSTQVDEDGQNYAGFANREADTLMEDARRTTDKTRRTDLYKEFQRVFAEEVPAILLYYPTYNYAIDSIVHGVQLGPLQTPSDRFRTIDRWYVATRRIIVSEKSQNAQRSN